MSIYRGAGGASDTTDQATVTEVTQKAAEAAASATSAASSASDAANSATTASTAASTATSNASTSTTNATNAAASASTASTAATNASNSATAAAASETNAAASEAAALASSTSASNSAASATTSASAAGSSASAAQSAYADTLAIQGAAATSATNAATSATAAAASATAAATSATTAATEASNAATSATSSATYSTLAAGHAASAEAAEAATLALFDQFGDQYLGAISADPISDNDGDPLTVGDVYFNTTDNVLKFYNGTSWTAPEDVASTAAANALASQTAAATSATSAATSASQASSSASAASSSASSASTSATNASNSAASAAASETSAEGHKDLAYTYWQNAASAVTYSDLEAIAATKAVTAVDVFVYDTRKDSDGGAWRKRTQHTSWYNETLNTATRGARKEFPAVAVIVAEASKVTIYDGDDPTLPMWMVFNSGTYAYIRDTSITSVAMLNGSLFVTGAVQGQSWVNFVTDSSVFTIMQVGANYRHTDAISGRNNNTSDKRITINDSNYFMVSNVGNDVAMTVLPSAPIDAATGLPTPTIAVATDGGVSVIKDDGTVVDITTDSSVGNEVRTVSFYSDKIIVGWNTVSSGNRHTYSYNIPTTDTTAGGPFRVTKFSDPTTTVADIAYNGIGYINKVQGIDASSLAIANASLGFNLVSENTTTPSEGMVSYITSSYNTGWMHGDVKLATLSSTTEETLSGSNLVVNGTFDVDTSGWTDTSAGSGTVSWNASGYIDLNGAADGRAQADQSVTTEVGKTYVFTCTEIGGVPYQVNIGTSAGGNQLVADTDGTGDSYFTFTATTTTSYIRLRSRQVAETVSLDNISVRLAEEDRSVNGNGLEVHGQITKAAVATGADLVAYSGFSANNYLEQPYNSDLDFGTGDFYVMGWFKTTDTTNAEYLLDRRDAASSGPRIVITKAASTNYVSVALGANSYVYNINVATSTWRNICVIRNSGVTSVYVDGVIIDSTATLNVDVSNTSAYLTVGNAFNKTIQTRGSLALWRIGAGAPTAADILKIYNDERPLFQDGAQATLYGSSDVVTALAYDEVTDLLHVGTSAGRSVFSGLKRVENTTDAVGTAISAYDSLVVEE